MDSKRDMLHERKQANVRLLAVAGKETGRRRRRRRHTSLFSNVAPFSSYSLSLLHISADS
jgi:hypothetical protein